MWCVKNIPPDIQLNLLKIDLHRFRQPVLDIGCGSSAGLVRYLRSLKIEAYGFDRQIEKAETYLQQSDWFRYRFEPETWGTITSNMAFSNHFLYVHHNDRSQLNLYTQKFSEILRSLVIGGSFHYAPGLFFIEECLEKDKYQVEQIALVKDIYLTRITRITN